MRETNGPHLEPCCPEARPAPEAPVGTAGLLKVLTAIGVGVSIVAVWSGCVQLHLLQAAQDGLPPTEAQANANDQRQGLIGIAQACVAISTWITFLVWTYRVNARLHRLGGEGMKFTPGWSVGWYFIPIANLWKPYQVMREIWTTSTHATPHERSKPVGSLVEFWWALALVSRLMGRLSARLLIRAESVDQLATASYLSILSDIVDIAFYLAAFALVWSLMGMHVRLPSSDSEIAIEQSAPLVDEVQSPRNHE